jgi:hypothetical protein
MAVSHSAREKRPLAKITERGCPAASASRAGRRLPGAAVRAPSPSTPVPGTMAWPTRRVWTPALTIAPPVHAHIGGEGAGLLPASLVPRLPRMRKQVRGRLVQARVRSAHRGSPLLGSSVRCGYLYYRPGRDPWSLGRLPSCSWPMEAQQPQPRGPLQTASSYAGRRMSITGGEDPASSGQARSRRKRLYIRRLDLPL